VERDASFPEIDPATWQVTAVARHEADDRHSSPMTFTTYLRRLAPPEHQDADVSGGSGDAPPLSASDA